MKSISIIATVFILFSSCGSENDSGKQQPPVSASDTSDIGQHKAMDSLAIDSLILSRNTSIKEIKEINTPEGLKTDSQPETLKCGLLNSAEE